MSTVNSNSFTTFGELLTFMRQRARLTQQELGNAVGYSRGQITHLERGFRQPDVDVVRARFVEALGLQHEPGLAARLIELAAAAHAETSAEAPPKRASGNLPMYISSRPILSR